MDREKIIEEIEKHRDYGGTLAGCPFVGCETCEDVFPRLENACPCYAYGRSYVKRRMKKLFPELYNGKHK